MGKACLSTDVGSIRELNAADNLLLSDPDEMENFEEHLLALLGDETLRQNLATLNRRLCLERFNEETMVKKTGELYASLERK
jgi:glycosyltransferase involved in cell wall biosynthesis